MCPSMLVLPNLALAALILNVERCHSIDAARLRRDFEDGCGTPLSCATWVGPHPLSILQVAAMGHFPLGVDLLPFSSGAPPEASTRGQPRASVSGEGQSCQDSRARHFLAKCPLRTWLKASHQDSTAGRTRASLATNLGLSPRPHVVPGAHQSGSLSTNGCDHIKQKQVPWSLSNNGF